MPTQVKMTKKRSIVFVQKDRFYYYDEASSRILQFVFLPNTIQDLEVFDYDLLNAQIKTFVETNKLAPANILFIFAEQTIFEKIFLKSQTVDKDKVVETFVENIPFENLSHKVYESPTEFKIIAINKEIYTALKSAFERLRFTALGAIAQFVIGENLRTRTALDAEMVRLVLSRFELLQKQNIVEEEVIKSTTGYNAYTGSSPEQVKQRKKYSVFALIGILPLILILFSVLYLQQSQKPRTKNPVPQTVVALTTTLQPSPISTETPTSTPSASPATASPTAIIKQIIR